MTGQVSFIFHIEIAGWIPAGMEKYGVCQYQNTVTHNTDTAAEEQKPNQICIPFVYEHAHVEQNMITNMEDDDKLACSGHSSDNGTSLIYSSVAVLDFALYRTNQSSTMTKAVC